jgi:hypothetical protein
LPEFGLINMNARLYDPVLGRMLSDGTKFTQSMPATTYPTEEGSRIALGLAKDLNNFAGTINALTYRQFTSGGFQKDQIL